ncbi:hypothetical protein LMH87_005337 [Akanthomyces muscarius]|uniref:Uncharacterized protein n=1 Tax=Akanthomyces muscarius TaxID=2231603 RepID=A0A9W8QLL7_AKAMU|nr:hypothetical protein LMH87_005337 [Akanthomyces muscarius]KAJ4163620.1 hypothetical protein LMH87_005337 [Akanthomyces muscarius]
MCLVHELIPTATKHEHPEPPLGNLSGTYVCPSPVMALRPQIGVVFPLALSLRRSVPTKAGRKPGVRVNATGDRAEKEAHRGRNVAVALGHKFRDFNYQGPT